MKRAMVTSFIVAIGLPVFATEEAQNGNWKLVKQSTGVAIYGRPHTDPRLKEFRAIGEIDAPTHTVHKVIDDVEAYPSFMPYTVEANVLKRDHNSLIAYQRLSPKIVGDRDYTLRIEKKSWPAEFGIAYLNEWKPANEHGPAERPGVFRVKLCTGSWLLEPAGANKTRATYSVFTDSGITVPFLANTISQTGIARLFAAVRKQAKEPKYQNK